MILVDLKKTDFALVNWVMTPQRFEKVEFTPTVYVQSLASILSVEETVHSKFSLLTFQPITWWLLIASLLIYSLINVRFKLLKSKNNFLIEIITSMINHFECLLTKQSELLKNFNFFIYLFHLSWFTFIKSNL